MSSLCSNEPWLLELRAGDLPPVLHELRASGPPPSARSHHTATLLGDTLYVVGGCGAGEATLREVYALHVPSSTWYAPLVSGTPPAILARHTATALAGSLFIFGGR